MLASPRPAAGDCRGRLALITDRTLLYRILFNRGDNALKYSDGPVELAARPEDGGVLLEVTDRGPGIPPEYLATIFEQFRQLDAPSAHRAGGVGLGLHLSARVAEVLGGRIGVVSEVGRGSTFSLWLPREVAADEAAPEAGGPVVRIPDPVAAIRSSRPAASA